MMRGVGADILICLCLVLCLGLCCFGFLMNMMACFPSLFSWCVHRECLLVLEAGVLGWLVGRKLEKKIFVVCWEWSPRGKGNHSKFPGDEAGCGDWILGALDEVWVCLQPTCCLWVSRGCLLELGSGRKQQVGGGKLGGEGLWKMHMWVGWKKGYSWCSIALLGMRLGVQSWNRERLVGSLPRFGQVLPMV